MADLTALQSVPGGQIGSGTAQVFNPMPAIQVAANSRQMLNQMDWHRQQAEMARQKAMADAKAKAAEEEVIAKYDVAEGNHFRQPVQEINDAEIAQDKADWAGMTKTQQMQRIADRDRLFKARNKFIASQDAAFTDTRTRLGKDYVIPATVEKNLVVDKVKNDPLFFAKDYAPEFEKTIRSNPAFYNWENVGQRITEKVGVIDQSTTDAEGRKKAKKYSQFLTGKKDPQTGLPVINKKIAMDLIKTDANATDMMNNYVAQLIPDIQKQFPNLTTQEAFDVAQGEAINKFFKGRGVYDVSNDLESTAQRAKSTAKGTELAGINLTREPSVVDFRFTPTSISSQMVDALDINDLPIKNPDGSNKKVPAPASQQVGKINFGNVQTWTTPKTPVPIASNKRILMLSDPKDALKAGLIEENPNGGYNLKLSAEANSGQIVDVHVFKKDVVSKTGGYKVRKGTPVTDDYYNKMSPQRRAELTETIKAYRFTPKLMTSELDEDTQALLFKNPKVGILDVLVPVTQAGEITTTLKRDYSKPQKTKFSWP